MKTIWYTTFGLSKHVVYKYLKKKKKKYTCRNPKLTPSTRGNAFSYAIHVSTQVLPYILTVYKCTLQRISDSNIPHYEHIRMSQMLVSVMQVYYI